MTFEQYNKVVSYITKEQKEEINIVWVIGGEPLCHPYFETLIKKIRKDFPTQEIIVFTNGKLLDRVSKDMFDICHFRVTRYEGFNDEVYIKYKDNKKVFWFNGEAFVDPYVDPNLPDDMAKEVDKRCNHWIRILGTKLYKCCISEGVERYYKTDSVHVEFDENWLENWEKLPNWKACKHCYIAIDCFVSVNEDGSYYFDKKKNLNTKRTTRDTELLKKYGRANRPEFK